MNFCKRTLISSTITLAFLANIPAVAQGQDWQLGAGAGVIWSQQAYGTSTTSPVPIIDFDSTYFRVQGDTADVKLPWISSETLSLSLRSRYMFGEGYKPEDADILNGMDRRRAALWTGPAIEWNTPLVDLSVEGMFDVSGDSEGSRIRVAASHTFFLSGIGLTPRVGATWLDSNTVDYYYGVRPEEATATRAAYEGSSTINFEAGISAFIALRENHHLMIDASVTRVGDGIADSPITVDNTLASFMLGYAYKF